MVSTAWDDTARVWGFSDGDPQARLAGHGGGVDDAAFLLDGDLVTGGNDGTVRAWNAATGELARVVFEQPGHIRSLAASPTLPLLAAGVTPGGDILVIDTDTGTLVRSWQRIGAHIWDMVFAADGRTLISAPETRRIHVYDVVTGDTLQVTDLHDGIIGGVAVSRDGSTLAAGTWGGAVRLWYRVGANIPPIAPVAPTDPAAAAGSDGAQQTLNAMAAEAEERERQAAEEAATAATVRVGPRTYALLVGVDTYDSFADLVNPVADVSAVEVELRRRHAPASGPLACGLPDTAPRPCRA